MYRKFKPIQSFTGKEFLPKGQVLITDESGVIEAITDITTAGDDIEELDGILSPGFINAHCHIELSHLKGRVAQHTGLVHFVQQVMSGREALQEEKQEAMVLAAKELYESGTVAVGDICNTTDSISLKQNNLLYWHNFIEVSGFIDAAADARLAVAEQVLLTFKGQYLPNATLVPHAPYSVSKTLFKRLNEKTAGQLISIHNQETAAEDELYLNKAGGFLELYKNSGIDITAFVPPARRSFPTWLSYFTKEQSIISVHNTFTNQQDLSLATFNVQHSKLFFCLCPKANLYIENRLPPVDLLIENNCKIVLGTDSYASNTSLNIMEEINTLRENFPHVSLEKMLQWATSNGAEALGISDRFGSFAPGKKPGIVLMKDGAAKRIL